MPHVPSMAKVQPSSTIDDQIAAAIEANNISSVMIHRKLYFEYLFFQVLIQECWRHRKEFESRYYVESQHAIPSLWTADLNMLKGLTRLFNLTVSTLRELRLLRGKLIRTEPDPFNETDPSPQILLNQLGDLTRSIFSCSSQRQGWLNG
jgi:hypothetical protein